MKAVAIAISTVISVLALPAQEPSPGTISDLPSLVSFAAPAYPRAARDSRMAGNAVAKVSVDRDGTVSGVTIISSHPVFVEYVTKALKQWRFKSSVGEHTLQVTCIFEIADACDGTNKHPSTAETNVSADLPNIVRIQVGVPCVEVDVN